MFGEDERMEENMAKGNEDDDECCQQEKNIEKSDRSYMSCICMKCTNQVCFELKKVAENRTLAASLLMER